MSFKHVAFNNIGKPKTSGVQTALQRAVPQCTSEVSGTGPSSAVGTESPPLVWSGRPDKNGQQLLSTGVHAAQTDSVTQGLNAFSLENCPTSCHHHVGNVRRGEEHV